MTNLFGEKYVQRLKDRSEEKKGPKDYNRFVASEVWIYFGRKKGKQELNFMRLLGMVERFGPKWIMECWASAKDSTCRDRAALFVHKVYKVRVDLKSYPQGEA